MSAESASRRRFYNPRIAALLAIALVVLGLFVLRLWDVQVVHSGSFRAQADSNRFRLEAIDAPRGIIYDRNGTPLVRNAPDFQVQIIPAYLPDDPDAEMKVYQRLSQLLDMPVESRPITASVVVPMGHGAPSVIDGMQFMADRLQEKISTRGCCVKDIVDEVSGIAPYTPVTIKDGLDRDLALHIAEESVELPGVRVNVATAREYISGTVTSQILGYLRRITEDDLKSLPPDDYNADTDRIGAVGVEAQLEDQLRGTKGHRYVEEDVVGREVRVVGQPQPAMPGDNVQLTIDFDLQQFAQQALQDEIDLLNSNAYSKTVTRRGAVIAMNPKTGEILAMVSLPSYDNNLFSRPVIKPSDLDEVTKDPYLPLINHAFQSAFPPGSTFKIVLAAAGLQEGVITPRTLINDPGVIVIPNEYFPDDPRMAQKFYGWYRQGFGDQNIVQALAHSVNVFFYELGGGYHVKNQPTFEGLGIDRLKRYAEGFGFGTKTGLNLSGEADGFVPDPVWKRRATTENWTLGDTYNMSIGQGYVLATPLQVLNAYAAIANNGVLMQPQIIRLITDASGNAVKRFTPQVKGQLPIDTKNLDVVRQGLDAVVNSSDGTGIKAQVPGVHVVGKTGTAEYCDDMAQKNGDCAPGRQPSHAWFAAYAPFEDPQMAVIVFIYNGGEGSITALPVAQKILQHWFEQHPPGSNQVGQLP
jgi:penicillin-binding protein 2